MERLTDNKINGWTFEETIKTAENLMEAEKNMFKWDVLRHLRDFAESYREKLADYEDLEEQGKILKLPCDKVYYIVDKNNPRFAMISCKSITDLTLYEINEIDIGGIYFSTLEKAEEKLKELRGE